MLRELSIRNFAIIDDLQIQFAEGLTVLTGETGAGKSIIINAVNLLLGSRAAPQLIRTGAESAELEAYFDISSKSSAARALQSSGYDAADGLLVRRIISQAERSRVYINGKLSTISLLNQITENLASISGQHAHQGLLKEDNHLQILDRFGGFMPQVEAVGRIYHEMLPCIRKLQELKALQRRQTEQMDLYRFQKNEIEAAAVVPGEDVDLERERVRLKNAAALYQAVHEGIEALYSSEGSVIENLTAIGRSLEKTAQIDSALTQCAEDIANVVYGLEDITENLRSYLGTLQMDEQRIEEVEARMDALNRLKRKYGGSLESVISHLSTITRQLGTIENIPEEIKKTENRLAKLRQDLIRSAQDLSGNRQTAAVSLAKRMETELATLRMSHTQFGVELAPYPAGSDADPYLSTDGNLISETGLDRAAFLIAPNVGEPLKPLAGIASGGELSRVVLALKAILAHTESVETIVFDEVDAGIGGSVAVVVGKKLRELAKCHQVICITHLPQIARFGDHHFQIAKQVRNNRTLTTLAPLRKKDRIEELARMLGGIEITEATRAHARELLENS